MFVAKEKGRKTGQFTHNYVELLTAEGSTHLMQFVLGEENSLVEFFRLFRCYSFYRLKVIGEGVLSFGMDSSKF